MQFSKRQTVIDENILNNLINDAYNLNMLCQNNNLKTGYAVYFDPYTPTLALVIDPRGRYQVDSLDGCQVLVQGDPMEVDSMIHKVSLVLKYQLGEIGGWR